MATTKHSRPAQKRKPGRAPVSISRKTEWASWMQGAHPEWFWSDEAKRYARAFNGVLPMWLVHAEPWREVTAERFKAMRSELLQLSVAQCAAYLCVSQAAVKRWESGEEGVPVAAFEALRQQSESVFCRMSHQQWDGWFIERQTGELVSPDVGKLALKPAELNALPMLYGELSMLRNDNAQKAARIDELEAENAALRAGLAVKAVAAELSDMQERIGEMLRSLHTADIVPFPVASDQPLLRKAAS